MLLACGLVVPFLAGSLTLLLHMPCDLFVAISISQAYIQAAVIFSNGVPRQVVVCNAFSVACATLQLRQVGKLGSFDTLCTLQQIAGRPLCQFSSPCATTITHTNAVISMLEGKEGSRGKVAGHENNTQKIPRFGHAGSNRHGFLPSATSSTHTHTRCAHAVHLTAGREGGRGSEGKGLGTRVYSQQYTCGHAGSSCGGPADADPPASPL